MAFNIYAEGGTDMLLSRAKLREMLDHCGSRLPETLRHIRRTEHRAPEKPDDPSSIGRATSAFERWAETVAAGPSHANEHWTPTLGPTEFEAEWAHLPPAISALPSFFRIKQFVMRSCTGRCTFQRSLSVLANGIDYCFKTRPAFRQILFDLETESHEALFDPVECAELLPPQPDPLTLTEALWESQFGVPRNLAWYTAPAESSRGVAGCGSTRFAPPNPARLGLARDSIHSPSDLVHCAVAGTKRPLSLVGPAAGLLYAVVQGTLLLITWPSSERNFATWYRLSRGIQMDQLNHLDELEDARINILRTGDVVYLPAGSINLIIAFSHVCMTSRQVLNPTAKDLSAILRRCNQLMDAYIEQQSIGYSPFDEMEVDRMDANVLMWTALFKHLDAGRLRRATYVSAAPATSSLGSLKKARPNSSALQAFLRGLEQIDKKISRYRILVDATDKRACQNDACECSHNRPFETLNALARLSSSLDSNDESAPPSKDPITEMLSNCTRSGSSVKGKERAPG